MRELKWAVLGCGVIANEMAQALEHMGKTLYAVGNRTHEKAVAYAEKYHVSKVYDDFHEMFEDPEVDIIYITTPHNTHIGFAKEAIANGKHVLCEKSVMLNSRELEEVIKLAEEKHLVFAEAMTIWHMPIYKKLWNYIELGKSGSFKTEEISKENPAYSMIQEGIPALGRVQLIQLNFGSYKEYNMNNRFFNMNLAGGALLDIGVYALSLMRSFMDSQPAEISNYVKFAPTGADEQETIMLANRQSQMATITMSLHSKLPKRAVISCEYGYIEIMEYPRADRAWIVEAESGKRYELAAGETAKALQYEMEDMELAVRTKDQSIMHLEDTRDVMEIMTNLRKEWDMKYPGEEW